MMTYWAPASLIIPALISPVKAPSRSQDMFCADTATLLLRAASLAACTAVNGGAMTTVTSLTSLTSPRSSFT